MIYHRLFDYIFDRIINRVPFSTVIVAFSDVNSLLTPNGKIRLSVCLFSGYLTPQADITTVSDSEKSDK